MLELKHDLRIPATRDEKGRRNFVSGLRSFVLHDMAAGLRHVYAADVEPRWKRRRGRAPRNGSEVHEAIRPNEYFKFYSALRVTAQDMVYQTVRPAVERSRESLRECAAGLAERRPLGSLELDPGLPIPRSVSAVDIHLMPGSYHSEEGPDDLTAGSIYDNRLAVSSFGLMGQNLDDIGQTVARWLRHARPQFAPRSILDLGCTVGHNTGPWKDQFPDAEVHGVDVAAPCLRYALARARSQGREIHFHQMNAESLRFADASFDVVFSSMFLHEIPPAGIPRILAEAWRVLRPGGLMVHMELPPNGALAPFDAFYLDWDCAYNNEPFYKPYRDLDPRRIVRDAGFDPAKFFEVALPSWGALSPREWREALRAGTAIESGRTGRLARGVRWYCFGAWK
ncbi:MAG: class I SAM-dependent methyltransferase [Steroidobacteraceae bacterium]|jgi:ubiquinone/menaquinone biosynthesis C-methylase UbiE|nr:class I SAM-dependent methyltransferase [Steroidobacteraceae bacterium]